MIKIKKSIGDNLLSITFELPPLGQKVDFKEIRPNPDRFLLGKWTTLATPDTFSFCQEVTNEERVAFTDAITSSEYSHEEVQKMPPNEFHRFIVKTQKIDWIPATRNLLTWIAALSWKPPTEEMDAAIRLMMPNKKRNDITLKEIKIPDHVKEIYTYIEDIKKPQKERKRKSGERLNHIKKFLDEFFIRAINQTPHDAWEAMKQDTSGNIIINEIEDPEKTTIQYRTKRINNENTDGGKKLADSSYTIKQILELARISQEKINKAYHQKVVTESTEEKPAHP